MTARRMVRRRWGRLAAGAGLAAVVVAVPVSLAQASDEANPQVLTSCGDEMKAEVGGGVAYWEAKCEGKNFKVSGWVKDIRSDGKCAQVKALIDGHWHYSKKACPSGEVERFSLQDRGRSGDVYLINV